MIVIPREGRNRIPLTGLLHTLSLLVTALAALPLGATGTRAPDPAQFTPAGDEVPFVVSPSSVTRAMLDIAGVGARDTLIDLGSGDGRIVIAAAQRGATALGVEIDPALVAKSEAAARAAGVAARARFVKQDLFDTDLSAASVVTMYLLQEVNLQLRPRLLALAPGTRIVSHDWHMGDWEPDRRMVVEVPDKPVGRDKMSTVMLWVVPARVSGVWCGTGANRRATLRLDQSFQRLSGELTLEGGRPKAVVGSAQGEVILLSGGERGTLTLRASGGTLNAAGADGVLAAVSRFSWRAGPAGCAVP